LGVKSGSTLFINGASGGIGSTAVQLAAARGARVIGAASAANQNYLSLLGAEPVTYGEGMIERVRALAPGGVDVALDVAGSGVLPQLIDLAGCSQNVVTLADFDGSKEHGVRFSNGFADGHAFHSLAEIGELIEAGRFWLPVDRTFPLAEIAQAHRTSEHGHVRGRLVLDDLFQGFDQAFVPCLFRYALNGVEPNVEPGLRKRRSGRSRYPL